MKRKTRAVIMNALLMPGIGQLYLGRKLHGVILIMLVNILMLVALFVLLKGAMPIVAAKISSSSVDPAAIESSIQAVAGLGKGVIAAFLAVWGFALFDLIKNGKED